MSKKTRNQKRRKVRRTWKRRNGAFGGGSKAIGRIGGRNGSASKKSTECCICGEQMYDKSGLETTRCKMPSTHYRHKICQDCWWHPERGFVLEGSEHTCPGCRKGLPTKRRTPPKHPLPVIDLTLDDSDSDSDGDSNSKKS